MGIPNAKKAIERLYTGVADVYDFRYTDTGHGAKTLSSEPEKVLEGIPCRISYEIKEDNDQDSYGDVRQEITMFCDPSYEIKPGARIEVTQAGATQEYECAGLRAMYVSHQEIRLEAFRERA